ncbi:MAG: zinc ribbon domain-containing protein [Thermoplasmata archaeon]
MKYCIKCGTANDDNANYCKQCGYPFPTAPQQQYTPASQVPVPPQPPYPYQGPYQQGYQQPQYGSPQTMQYTESQSANTMILIAFIFSIISIMVFVIEAILSIGAYVALIVYLVFAVFAILVFLKTWKIYNFTEQRKYQEAYQEDTISWAVLGIIFGLIITGVFLLLARTHLENALRPHNPY